MLHKRASLTCTAWDDRHFVSAGDALWVLGLIIREITSLNMSVLLLKSISLEK